jgi:acyl carrier protein
MENSSELKGRIKQMLVDNLMLQYGPDQIGDEQPLFGREGLGLDSVDALQVVVGIEKNYGLKIPNPDAAREILRNVNTITAAVEAHQVKTAD